MIIKPLKLTTLSPVQAETAERLGASNQPARNQPDQPRTPMTLGDFRKLTADLPDNLPMLETRCSDYSLMEAASWSIQAAVRREGVDWLSKVPEDITTMSRDDQRNAKWYLHFDGN